MAGSVRPRFRIRSGPGILAGVFLLALGVRIAYLLAFSRSPFFDHLMVDGQWHDEWAWDWARGAWNPEGRAFFRAPGYPFWLSLLYRVFGHDLWAVRIVQAVLGASTAVAVAGTAGRLAGRGAALTAGVAAALYGPLIFFDGELLIPNLLLALLAWALFLWTGRPGGKGELAGGLLLGLAVVTRPNALALVPLGIGWIARRSPGNRRRAGLFAALALAPALAVTGINYALEGTWVFVAGQGGVNFYAGNHAGASGRSVQIPELMDIVSWRQFTIETEAVAERSVGRPLDSREVSDWWTRRALDWITAHPVAALRLTARKAYYLLNGYETANNRGLYFDRPAPLRWLVGTAGPFAFPWGLVFPVGVAGAVLAWRDPRLRGAGGLLAGWILLYGASVLPFFISARFRLALVLPLLVLCGIAVSRRRSFGPAAATAGIAALILSNTAFLGARVANPAQSLAMLGDARLREGETAEGIAALERAAALEPNSPAVAALLAEAYARAGRHLEAAERFEALVARRPGDPDLRFNLGVEYLQLERYDDAANTFTVAGQLKPEDAAVWTNLGVAQEARGLTAEAEAAYREAIRRGPGEVLPVLRLASLLGDGGRFREAVTVLVEAGERMPENFETRYALALLLARTGRLEGAALAVEEALERRPGDPRTLELRDWIRERR